MQDSISTILYEGIPTTSRVARARYHDVNYFIWTRVNRGQPDTIKHDVGIRQALKNSHFNPKLETKILIHGYKDHGLTGWIMDVKYEYLKKGKFTM